jgi:hypothetical protein
MSETPELGLLQLPHAIAGAFDAIARLETAQIGLVGRLTGSPGVGQTAIQLIERDKAFPLVFAIDSYLESAVRMQDGIWHYVKSALGVGTIGGRLNAAATMLAKRTVRGVSDDLRECTLAYWRDGGERLRSYRDLSQHYGVIASDVRVALTSDADPLIYLALPSDPTQRKPSHFHYDDPIVWAYPYCRDTFLQLVRWIYRLADIIAPGAAPPPIRSIVFLSGPPYHRGQFNGYPVGQDGAFAQATNDMVRSQDRPETASGGLFSFKVVNRVPE